MFLCSEFKPKPYQIAVSTDSNFRRVQQCRMELEALLAAGEFEVVFFRCSITLML